MAQNTTTLPTVIDLDERIHTDERPFCIDETCPCHEDSGNLSTLEGWYNDGLVGVADATLIFTGRTV